MDFGFNQKHILQLSCLVSAQIGVCYEPRGDGPGGAGGVRDLKAVEALLRSLGSLLGFGGYDVDVFLHLWFLVVYFF